MRMRVGAFLGCVVLALSASPALAKKKHRKQQKLGPVVTVTATGNVATVAAPQSTATATCPSGKQAVGGGFTSPLTMPSAVIVHDSYRSAPGAWTVAGQQVNGQGAVNAYAYCRNAKGHPVTDVSESTTLTTSGENRTVTPSCPVGTRLIGGGFRSTVATPADAVIFPEVNQANSPTAWTVTGVQNQDGPLTLTGHAYCMAKIGAPAILNRSSSATVPQLAIATSTSPSCPVVKKSKKKRKKKPSKLLSAGGFSSPLFTPGSPEMVFGESRLLGAGWFASATNAINQTGTVSVNSQGICF